MIKKNDYYIESNDSEINYKITDVSGDVCYAEREVAYPDNTHYYSEHWFENNYFEKKIKSGKLRKMTKNEKIIYEFYYIISITH